MQIYYFKVKRYIFIPYLFKKTGEDPKRAYAEKLKKRILVCRVKYFICWIVFLKEYEL